MNKQPYIIKKSIIPKSLLDKIIKNQLIIRKYISLQKFNNLKNKKINENFKRKNKIKSLLNKKDNFFKRILRIKLYKCKINYLNIYKDNDLVIKIQ